MNLREYILHNAFIKDGTRLNGRFEKMMDFDFKHALMQATSFFPHQ